MSIQQITPPATHTGVGKHSPRLRYIDVAKGILILFVIYNHTGNLAAAQGIDNETINFIPQTRFFVPFFMPAFFVIAGMCSNYHKRFKDFVVSNAKALLIPAVTLLFVRILVRFLFTGTLSRLELGGIVSPAFIVNLGYYNWFLTALFTTKLLFYGILHVLIDFKKRAALLVLLHLVGVVLYNEKGDGIVFYNFYFYQHALLYCLYIEIGYELTKNNQNSPGLIINAVIFFVVYICYLLMARRVPSVTSDPYLPIVDVIPHLLMSVCGSMMLMELSRKIKSCSFLEDFGKHSLVIYCLHFQFMFSYYQIFKEQLNTMGVHYTITALVIMYIFTAYGCLWFSKLLNTRQLKWILGKF